MLFDIAVSSAAGIEGVTKRELFALGVKDAPAVNGRILFKGDERKIIDCNLRLRTASRVYIVLASFKAYDFDELFGGVHSVPWGDILPADADVQVEAKCVSSKLMAYAACASVAKKALFLKLSEKYGELVRKGERYCVEISVCKNTVTVSLDTSGEGLHRRGYRGLVGEAPLKETVAAALVLLSGWDGGKPFTDIFCGTGTIPIEAAMYALKMAPGLNRRFDFENWKGFDFSALGELKERARAEIDNDREISVSGYDIDEGQLRLARKHAALAGVEGRIHFQKRDARCFSSGRNDGFMIVNPPYGERLSERKEVAALYKDFGKVMSPYGGWKVGVLTSVPDFERLYGRRADKKRKIFNGKLECCYYLFGKNEKNAQKPVHSLDFDEKI